MGKATDPEPTASGDHWTAMNPERPVFLVIFGAGASYDSGHNSVLSRQVDPLPLVKDLVGDRFTRTAAEIPNSLPIIDRLRSRMTGTNSLESELAKIAADAENAVERRQQLVAFRFYLHKVINNAGHEWFEATHGLTHYLTLLNRIYEWQQQTGGLVRLATFNYDTLLDLAASAVYVGWELVDFSDYVARNDVRLFKLHGSTAWSRAFQTHESTNMRMIPAAMSMAADNSLIGGRLVHQPPAGQVFQQHAEVPREVMLPAMAIPMADKTDFECPAHHTDALKRDLPNVTHLLIIGWRAAEPHAVQLLAGSEPREGLFPSYRLGIVSGSEADIEEIRGHLDMAINGISSVLRKAREVLREPGGFHALTREQLDEFLMPNEAPPEI